MPGVWGAGEGAFEAASAAAAEAMRMRHLGGAGWTRAAHERPAAATGRPLVLACMVQCDAQRIFWRF
jgi:hypothetical protein